jgi:hypothetical protein
MTEIVSACSWASDIEILAGELVIVSISSMLDPIESMMIFRAKIVSFGGGEGSPSAETALAPTPPVITMPTSSAIPARRVEKAPFAITGAPSRAAPGKRRRSDAHAT